MSTGLLREAAFFGMEFMKIVPPEKLRRRLQE